MFLGGKTSHSSLQVVKVVFEYVEVKVSLCHRSVSDSCLRLFK